MTKIIIEESITSTIKTGVGQHTKVLNNLVKNLDCEYEIVSNKFVEQIQNATLKRICFLIWLNTVFFLKLLFQQKDTVVIYTSFLPLIKISKLKQIGIIHDILYKIYPSRMSFLNKINNTIMNWLIKNNADKVLTVSKTIKDEIKSYLNIEENKIKVVYNSYSLDKNIQVDEDEVLKKYNLLNEKYNYLLSVSSLNPNKNIELLLQSFDLISKNNPNLKLVLTGGKENFVKKYSSIIDNKNIVLTGYLQSEELKVIQKYANIFVFPSVYEGFGIPIIDSQLLEVPVLCNDIPVFREIGKDSVIYAKNNKQDFAEKVNLLLNDKNLRNDIIEKGKINHSNFDFKHILEQFKDLVFND